MAITDDLIHDKILGWSADPGTPAQRVEQALQGWRNRFGGEPQIVLYAPSKGTAIRGENDDPLIVARQSDIEFREYEVVGKDCYYIAVKFGSEVQTALRSNGGFSGISKRRGQSLSTVSAEFMESLRSAANSANA